MSGLTGVKMVSSGKLGLLSKKVKGHQGMIIGSVIVISVIAIALARCWHHMTPIIKT